MKRFEGKVVVITGVTRPGIGEATAAQMVDEGARVVICGRGVEGGQAIERQLNGIAADSALFVPADVAEFDQVQTVFDETVARFGKVDILFNNAGIGTFGETPDVPIEEFKRMFEVDVYGTFYCCKLAIPLMRKVGGGVIVNNASISGIAADNGLHAYNAAKAAVINYTRALAVDHGKDNIRANAVCPGFVVAHNTQIMLEPQYAHIADRIKARIPLGRLGAAEDIANVVCFLASDQSAFMTGATIVVDGGMTITTALPDIRSAFS